MNNGLCTRIYRALYPYLTISRGTNAVDMREMFAFTAVKPHRKEKRATPPHNTYVSMISVIASTAAQGVSFEKKVLIALRKRRAYSGASITVGRSPEAVRYSTPVFMYISTCLSQV